MTESGRNLALTIGAGTLVAGIAFAAGRLSAPVAAPFPAPEVSVAAAGGASESYRALQRSIDEQRRDQAERDKRFQQQLDQQRYDAEMDRMRAERARIDAETEQERQRTQQLLDQQQHDAEMARAKDEAARKEAESQLARLRMQQLLDELSRK